MRVLEKLYLLQYFSPIMTIIYHGIEFYIILQHERLTTYLLTIFLGCNKIIFTLI